MATKKKATKSVAKKNAVKPATVKRKFNGTYSPKLVTKLEPKKETKAFEILQLMKKGKTAAEIAAMGYNKNTVVARFSDYRRINGLASTGKVFDKDGNIVKKEAKAKAAPVKAKKETPKPAAKQPKPKQVKAPKKKAAMKEMGISDKMKDAVEIEEATDILQDTGADLEVLNNQDQ